MHTQLEKSVRQSAKEGLLGSTSACSFRFDTEALPQAFTPELLQNSLTPVFANAAESMRGGGVIAVRCRAICLGEDAVAGVPAGGYIHISIADAGCGIPANDLSRVFEPGYSTKPGRKGMGLTIARDTVQKAHGFMYIESAAAQGTTVHIYAPAS